MKRLCWGLCLGLWCCIALSGPLEDRLMSVLVAPDRILKQGAEIELSSAQEQRIRQEINQAQVEVLQLQAGLLRSLEQLVERLQQTGADEASALADFNELTRTEAAIKQLHFRTWLRANAVLQPQQRARLQRP